MKKRILSILLCLALLLTMLPTAVFANDVPQPTEAVGEFSNPNIYVSGVKMTPNTYLKNGATSTVSQKPTGTGYAYWDGLGTLTLNNFSASDVYAYSSSTSCVYYSGSYTVKLVGQNVLENYDYDSDAITVAHGDLTIVGPGSVVLSADYPLFAFDNVGGYGNVTISGASVNCKGPSIYGELPLEAMTASGKITLLNSTVKVAANSIGIDCGSLTVTNSTLDIMTFDGIAIQTHGFLKINSPCKVVIPTGTRIMNDGTFQYLVDSNGTPVSDLVIAAPFSDVSRSAYYYTPVYWAVANGITNGVSPTKFEPNAPCTRAQAVTFIWRFCGQIDPSVPRLPFKDISKNSFYYDALRFCVQAGITNGTTATTFEPNKACTRAQIVTFLWRACGEPEPTITSCAFQDIQVNSFYYDAMMWAVQNGITSGTSYTTFSPNKTCTRGEIVTFLYRTQQYLNSVV